MGSTMKDYHRIEGNTKFGEEDKSIGGVTSYPECEMTHGTGVPACSNGRTARHLLQAVHLNNFSKQGYIRISIGRDALIRPSKQLQ